MIGAGKSLPGKSTQSSMQKEQATHKPFQASIFNPEPEVQNLFFKAQVLDQSVSELAEAAAPNKPSTEHNEGVARMSHHL